MGVERVRDDLLGAEGGLQALLQTGGGDDEVSVGGDLELGGGGALGDGGAGAANGDVADLLQLQVAVALAVGDLVAGDAVAELVDNIVVGVLTVLGETTMAGTGTLGGGGRVELDELAVLGGDGEDAEKVGAQIGRDDELALGVEVDVVLASYALVGIGRVGVGVGERLLLVQLDVLGVRDVVGGQGAGVARQKRSARVIFNWVSSAGYH